MTLSRLPDRASAATAAQSHCRNGFATSEAAENTNRAAQPIPL